MANVQWDWDELWDVHEAFLGRNGIKALDDEEAFLRAHNGLEAVISDNWDWLREYHDEMLVIRIDELKADLARLEEVWFLANGKHL
jgi:hypothetical protein